MIRNVIIIGVLVTTYAVVHVLTQQTVDKPLPRTSLSLVDGRGEQSVDSAETLGQGLRVVNFWASWCGACEAETDTLAVLHQKLPSEKDVRMVGISLDSNTLDAGMSSKVDKVKYPLLMDAKGGDSIASWLGVHAIPQTVVLHDGKVIYRVAGPLSKASLDKVLAAVEKNTSDSEKIVL